MGGASAQPKSTTDGATYGVGAEVWTRGRGSSGTFGIIPMGVYRHFTCLDEAPDQDTVGVG